MKYSNIQLFDLITGELFAQLYESFPAPCEIEFTSLGVKFIDPSDYDGSFMISDFAEDTAKWLSDADYIWLVFPESIEAKHTARLTPKGLAILKSIPDSLKEKTSLGERMVDFSKRTVAESLSDTVKLAMEMGVKYLATIV
jgi:hypothetical protein